MDHAIANKKCRDRMGAAFALNKAAGSGQPTQEQVNALNEKLTAKLDEDSDASIAAESSDGEPPPSPKPKPKSKRQRTLTEYKKK